MTHGIYTGSACQYYPMFRPAHLLQILRDLVLVAKSSEIQKIPATYGCVLLIVTDLVSVPTDVKLLVNKLLLLST